MKGTHVLMTGLLLSSALSLCAESFRVRSVSLVALDSQKAEAQVVALGYNDAIAIVVPASPIFLKGVEIEVKIPQGILSYRNSMAYSLYHRIRPAPSTATIDYQGEELTFQPLPSRLSFVLQVPFMNAHGLKSGPYATVLTTVYDAKKGPLLFRLLPIMKGLPEDIETMQFPVRIKPILTEEGAFRLSLAWPGNQVKPVSVRIDESLVENAEELVFLAPGTHHLSVVSDEFRNEVRVFTIESARITELTVPLQDTAPRLFLVAPENAVIQVDGKPVENPKNPYILEPGEHAILFKIGDYELMRQITAEKGRDYTVSMVIDINVTESP